MLKCINRIGLCKITNIGLAKIIEAKFFEQVIRNLPNSWGIVIYAMGEIVLIKYFFKMIILF